MLPRAIFFDLDDTILSYHQVSLPTWRRVCTDFIEKKQHIEVETILAAINGAAKDYWNDPERHRLGRLALDQARREVVRAALETFEFFSEAEAYELADGYSKLHQESIHPFPEAIETVQELVRRGVKLALITNGNAQKQRYKIEKFQLAQYFEVCLVEEEVGFGKPDQRVFELALERLGVTPSETWMVGDNLEWDIEIPKQLGIYTIWNDYLKKGLSADSRIIPDRIIHQISELLEGGFIRKQRTFTENEIFPYATMNDLKLELIEKARIMAVNRQPHHPWESMTNNELLRSVGLIQKDFKTGKEGLTLACILLFGRDESIISVLPYYKTDAILRRKNLDRYDDRDDIRCNLIESYERLMNFVEKHLDDPFYLEGDTRMSLRNKLFREVVANILMHREYSNPFPAKFIIENKRVIAENGNKAHGFGEIDLDNFTPYPKNPTIAKVFKEIGRAEELGSGIRNIKKYCKIYSNSKPVFVEGDIFTTIIELEKIDNQC